MWKALTAHLNLPRREPGGDWIMQHDPIAAEPIIGFSSEATVRS
jgi:hypothetical protein